MAWYGPKASFIQYYTYLCSVWIQMALFLISIVKINCLSSGIQEELNGDCKEVDATCG